MHIKMLIAGIELYKTSNHEEINTHKVKHERRYGNLHRFSNYLEGYSKL